MNANLTISFTGNNIELTINSSDTKIASVSYSNAYLDLPTGSSYSVGRYNNFDTLVTAVNSTIFYPILMSNTPYYNSTTKTYTGVIFTDESPIIFMYNPATYNVMNVLTGETLSSITFNFTGEYNYNSVNIANIYNNTNNNLKWTSGTGTGTIAAGNTNSISVVENEINFQLFGTNYLTVQNNQNMKQIQINNTIYTNFPVTIPVSSDIICQCSGEDDKTITVNYTNTSVPVITDTQ